MSLADHMHADVREKASAVLGVPVLGMCPVNRLGTLSNIATRAVANVASDLFLGETVGPGGVPKDEIRRAGAPATPLPHAFVLAITATDIHVFA